MQSDGGGHRVVVAMLVVWSRHFLLRLSQTLSYHQGKRTGSTKLSSERVLRHVASIRAEKAFVAFEHHRLSVVTSKHARRR